MEVGKTRAQRSAAFRSRLLSAVERLLVEHRFADITIDQILGEALVSRSTFYTYFRDKSALLLSVAEAVFSEALHAADPWWMLPPTATRDDLEATLGRIFDLYARHRGIVAAVIEASATDPTVKAWFDQSQDGAIGALEQHIRHRQGEGVIRPSLIPRETAGWIVWMIERGLYEMLDVGSTAHTSRLLRALTDLVYCALYANPPEVVGGTGGAT